MYRAYWEQQWEPWDQDTLVQMDPHDVSESPKPPVTSAIWGMLILLSWATKQSENMRKKVFFFVVHFSSPFVKQHLWAWNGAKMHIPIFHSLTAVIPTCALCTSGTMSAQETTWGFTLQVNSLGTDHQHNHVQTRAKRKNWGQEFLLHCFKDNPVVTALA